MFYAPFIRKKFLCASCVLMIAVVNSLMVSLVPLCVRGEGLSVFYSCKALVETTVN